MILVDVEALLPQKRPFVMVDTLLDYSEDSLKSSYTVRSTDIFIKNNQFQEAGIIEHMAQTVALHTGYRFYLKNEVAPNGYIGSISNVEIQKLPLVGEKIVTEVTILQEFLGITLVSLISTLNDGIIASGKMKTVLAK